MANGLSSNPDILSILTDLELTAYLRNFSLEIDPISDPFGIRVRSDNLRVYYLKFKVIITQRLLLDFFM
jgi:hypothetical protein